MTRLPIIIANWKTNKQLSDVYAFLAALTGHLPSRQIVQVGIAAQDIYLHEMVRYLNEYHETVDIIAENVHWADNGSYTGETSPAALADIGVKGSIIGHYERRKMFKETNGTVGLKVVASLRNRLMPVIAIAEDTTRYNPNDVDMAPLSEIAISLAGVTREQAGNIVIAYEPAWAIGAAEAPSLKEIEHAARVIRKSLAILFSDAIAQQIRIQYGGSVTPDNARAILGLSNIDGLLIGRAALSAETFITMTQDAVALTGATP